ncbi:golvesin C-terminal-like domain-containing protein [Massilibacteroides vaginae]|uniref:golvesin C-terminal-like domain-containing protein n=1 Tax=Massilibacteroides vaginae TaxID=1673718 RepID=UPI000A1CD48D|nr:xanthan lyase [Massilibacteroides vaginae]
MNNLSAILLFILLFAGHVIPVKAQTFSSDVKGAISHRLDSLLRKDLAIGEIIIDSVVISDRKKEVKFFANMNCSYVPFRPDNVDAAYRLVNSCLPKPYSRYKTALYTDGRLIENLIPLLYKEKKEQRKAQTFTHKKGTALVTRLSTPNQPEAGLQNRHIALWQSHGYYYESKLTRWEWQRARIFQTVEDLYTQAYVLPYLVPMLENAGANVLIPRERDVQKQEVIVDNDGVLDQTSTYTEHSGENLWQTGSEVGFAHLRQSYKDFENPFKEGTFRQINSIRKGKESTAEWIPNLPEKGSYAVYVSYKTLKNSADDALYTVFHKGGSTQFRVNQQMGGGTWIYLGHFSFEEGQNPSGKVVLSNLSSKAGRMVTADGVKFGGGMGTIARRVAADNQVSENVKSSESDANKDVKNIPSVDYPYETSGYPRFTEAARYWMQWAGVPDSVYSDSQGVNDYTDDYKSRGKWVNYISGGSAVNPDQPGLHIPIDMAFAFHSDAGTTGNDSIIGTLGIFCTASGDGTFANKASRYVSRDLNDLIQSAIVDDIRALYEPEWSRRGMWNKSYNEAREPNVPTMLLELLSHQNFADMRYGLDPRFRFTVSRSIYKGILKFIASQYKQDYVIQPLPVDHLNLRFVSENEVELKWQAVEDVLEPTAKAEKYIVYTRMGDEAFDNGQLVEGNVFRASQSPGIIYSYKVTAVNRGGESFPSEILSAGKVLNEKGKVLVVNAFNRVSAPADFVTDSLSGFLDQVDHGVPYLNDISYIGSMTEFRKHIPWMDDDAAGFGASRANYETMVVAGNSFDYPALHGASLMKAGYSFVSCSDESVEQGQVRLTDYSITDWILGKECKTKIGRGNIHPREFAVFSPEARKAITDYCEGGGNLFVSGAYVGTDLWDNGPADEEGIAFATRVLNYKWRTNLAAITGSFKSVASPFTAFSGTYNWHNTLNEESYVVESPDGIEPASPNAFTIFRYSENNLSAGVAYKGDYRTCVLGIPFESVKTQDARDRLMQAVLTFFDEK